MTFAEWQAADLRKQFDAHYRRTKNQPPPPWSTKAIATARDSYGIPGPHTRSEWRKDGKAVDLGPHHQDVRR